MAVADGGSALLAREDRSTVPELSGNGGEKPFLPSLKTRVFLQ